MEAQTAPATRNAPLVLWRAAEMFMQALHMLFGDPTDVADSLVLTRKSYALMVSWIRVGEAMLRRLLMIEAAAVAGEPIRPRRHAVRSRGSRACSSHAEAAAETSCRVSFRCLVSDRRRLAGGKAGGPRKEPARFRSALPLATRYAAILRVFTTPDPFARRLARRLRAQPHRTRALLHAPPEYQHRVDRAGELTQAAERAWPLPDSS